MVENKTISFLLALFLFLIFLCIVTFPLIFKMTSHLYGPVYGTDNRATVRDFWFLRYSFLHHIDYYKESFMNFPYQVRAKEYSLLPFRLSPRCLVSVLTNEIFAYNFFILGSFLLSFIGAYFLIRHLTKSSLCAFVGGVIYSLTPYHFNRAWEHYSLTSIEFFPLLLLFLFKLKENPILRNVFLAAFFAFCVFLSDLSYAYIGCVFMLLFFSFSILFNIKNGLSKTGTAQLIKCFFLLSLILLFLISPAILPVIKQMFFSKASQIAPVDNFIRPIKYLFSQSARPLNYFIPAYCHPVFGKFTASLFGSIFYGRDFREHTLFLGWVPLFLSFFAYEKYRFQTTKENKFFFQFLISSILVGFLFSMPPYFDLIFFKIYFPSFFMYKIFPMFRAYSRFGILVILGVSSLAALGLKFLLQPIKNRIRILGLVALITGLILFEFLNIPPWHVTNINSNIPAEYLWLKNQPGNFAVAEYPLRLGDTFEGFTNLDYLLYQRIHEKKLVNGSTPSPEMYDLLRDIFHLENQKTALTLEKIGVKYIVVHLDDYRAARDMGRSGIIGEAPDFRKNKLLKIVKTFDQTEIYEIAKN